MTVASGLITPFDVWRPVSGESLGTLAAAAVFLLFGYIFTVMTVRVGDISFSAPFRYTNLVWAILLGIVIFNHIPDSATLIGSSIVVATGHLLPVPGTQGRARQSHSTKGPIKKPGKNRAFY